MKADEKLRPIYTGQKENVMSCMYEVDPRPKKFGGGWRLRLLEDGLEVGGGVFIPTDTTKEANVMAYSDAIAEGEGWLATR